MSNARLQQALSLIDDPLGEEVTRYTGRRFSRRDLWLLFLPGALAVLAPLAYGFERAAYGYAQFGPAAAAHWARPWYLLSSLGLSVFALLLILRLWQARQRVVIHQNGLRLRLGLRREKRLRWQEIAGLAINLTQSHFLQIPLRNARQLTLYPNLGKPVRLHGNLQQFEQLSEQIQTELRRTLLPQLQAAFDRGQWVYFGPLAVQQHGLRLDRRLARPGQQRITPARENAKRSRRQIISWHAVRRLEVVSGFLVVELEDGNQRRIPIAKIPNLELLFHLIQKGFSSEA